MMQIVLSFKIMCNQRSHHTNWLLPLSCHQCAQEVDRSMPLETNICPTVNTWTSSSHEFRVKKVVTQHVLITSPSSSEIHSSWRNSAHELHNELHNELIPPVCILLKLPSEKNKANPKNRCRRNENLSLT